MNTRDLTWRVVNSRWLVLAAGLCIESIAGAAYAFGVYSQSLKLALGYDQKQLDTLAFYKTIGANVGVPAGLLYNVVPPWIVIIIGAAECSFGYSMLWLSLTGRISPAFWQMCIFISMAANSNTFLSTATVVTNVQNFPMERGLVIGLLKGFLGLSGAILTPVFYAVYPNDPSSFLLLISWLPAAVAILLMAFIRVLPASEEENSTFTNFSRISTCLAAYLTVVIILEKVWSDQSWLFQVLCLLLLGFFLSFFVVVIKAELKEGCADSAKNCVRDQNVITEPLLSDQDSELIEDVENESDAGVDEPGRDLRRGTEHTLSQAVSSLDFWLLAVIMFCSMGSGTTAIDNMGQIGASIGYKQVEINTFVSLISIWNFLGRFGAGLVSDFLLRLYGTTRPCCLAFSLGLMCVGHLVMASAVPGSLYVGSIVIGVCYGAQWSLMPAITSELFGLRHFGTLYNTITISNPAAAYILSVGVAGYLYDREAQKQHDPSTVTMWLREDPLLCQGPSCFRITFIILAILCACGCVICVWLFSRTKRFYAQVHESLLKVD